MQADKTTAEMTSILADSDSPLKLKSGFFFNQNRETKVYTGARAFYENTKTALAGCLKLFQNFLSPIWHSEGPKHGYFGVKIGPFLWAGYRIKTLPRNRFMGYITSQDQCPYYNIF